MIMLENEILLGIKIKKLGDAIFSQLSAILLKQNYPYEPRSILILIILEELGRISVKEVAELLGMTHPAIVQMVSYLNKVGLISQSKSLQDKRVTLLELTEKGIEALVKIEPVTHAIKSSLKSIINSIDVNFIYSISKLEQAVKSRLLIRTIEDGLKQRRMKDILITPYQKKYKSDFARLNYDWLQKYFEVEKEDERLLKNPEKEIIKKGGEVFLALENDEVVGTCAVLKINDLTYELTKMAVAEKAQGKQIGKKLALTAIGYAVEKGANKLKLSTSTKLNAALNLYKSLGFEQVEANSDSRYKRKLIHMELDLTTE